MRSTFGEQAREAEDAFFWVTHHERGAHRACAEWMSFASSSVDDVLGWLDSSAEGLSGAEASARLVARIGLGLVNEYRAERVSAVLHSRAPHRLGTPRRHFTKCGKIPGP